MVESRQLFMLNYDKNEREISKNKGGSCSIAGSSKDSA